MKFQNIFSVFALASMAQAAPAQVDVQARDVQRCKAPGAHQCAVVVWASLASLGLPLSTVGGSGVDVVGGDCGNIIADGKLSRDSPGFSADFTTAYGPHLYFGANTIGIGNMNGIRFQYNGKSYTQDNCFSTGGTSGLQGVDALQCNFEC